MSIEKIKKFSYNLVNNLNKFIISIYNKILTLYKLNKHNKINTYNNL